MNSTRLVNEATSNSNYVYHFVLARVDPVLFGESFTVDTKESLSLSLHQQRNSGGGVQNNSSVYSKRAIQLASPTIVDMSLKFEG